MKWVLAVCGVLVVSSAMAQERRPAPAYVMPKGVTVTKQMLDFDSFKIEVAADARIVQKRALTEADKAALKDLEDVGRISYVYDVKLAGAAGKPFGVFCNTGASDDPNCLFVPEGKWDAAMMVDGLNFSMPGDGCVYASGHANAEFAVRRKYCLGKDGLAEVPQAGLYVGIRSSVLRPLTLTQTKDGGAVVSKLPVGAFIEVLMQDGEVFLARDGFGLIGWTKIASDVFQPLDVKDMIYAGD